MLSYCCLLLLTILAVALGMHRFTPPLRMQGLLNNTHAAQALKNYIVEQEERISNLKGLLADLDVQSEYADNATLEHPITAYKFLLVASKLSLAIKQNQPLKHYNLRVESLQLPTYADIMGAATNIENIRSVYRISLSDLIRGDVLGHLDQPMNAADVFLVGDAMLQNRDFRRAIPWLEACLGMSENPVDPNLVTTRLIRCYENMIHWAVYVMAQVNDLPNLFTNIEIMQQRAVVDNVAQYRQHLDKLLSTARNPSQLSLDSDMEIFPRLCRNQDIRVIHKIEDSRTTGCSYLWREIPYKRIKKEILSTEPYVVLYHDVITDRENILLRKMSKKSLLLHDKKHNTGVSKPSNARITSAHICWMNGLKLLNAITKRMSAITGLASSVHPGVYQVVDYGVGAFDIPVIEVESTNKSMNRSADANQLIEAGMAGFALYLTKATEGGSRVFIRSGLRLEGVKNGAMVWYNQHPSGDTDWTSIQSVCPVVYGSQLVLRKWFHVSDQMFRRPCPLHRFSTHFKSDKNAALLY